MIDFAVLAAAAQRARDVSSLTHMVRLEIFPEGIVLRGLRAPNTEHRLLIEWEKIVTETIDIEKAIDTVMATLRRHG